MFAYQKFMKVWEVVKETYDDMSLQEQAIRRIDNMTELKKKYEKLYGITNEDIITQIEMKNLRYESREIKLYLQTAHIFEIEDKHKSLLLLTKTPNFKEEQDLWKQVRLPYPEIFIDVNFGINDSDDLDANFYGILLREMKSFNFKGENDTKTITPNYLYGLECFIAGVNAKGNCFVDKYSFPIIRNDGKEITKPEVYYTDTKRAKFFHNFIVNFILFLKDREVITIDRLRNQERQEKRAKQGSVPLPNSHFIKLTGEIYRYVNSIRDTEFKGKLSYQFWVMGYWRTYKSEKWKTMKGKIIWIAPFKKGQGILVKNTYRIIPNETDNVLDYDDIKGDKK